MLSLSYAFQWLNQPKESSAGFAIGPQIASAVGPISSVPLENATSDVEGERAHNRDFDDHDVFRAKSQELKQFWAAKCHKFEKLEKVAKAYFASPVSSAKSESTFSIQEKW